MFQELLPWGLMGAGFLIGGVVVYAVISWIVGGVESVYTLNAKNVALAAMKRGWRYSDRLQVPLFKNEWGT